MIDQGSVPRFSRSNPVLYSDAWGPIKEAFGRTSEATLAGFTASDFSFNAGQGRCDSCLGLGYENVEMQFYQIYRFLALFVKVEALQRRTP